MEFDMKEKTDSCKISINAKGQFSAEIKAYDYDLDSAVKSACRNARDMLKIIKEQNEAGEKK